MITILRNVTLLPTVYMDKEEYNVHLGRILQSLRGLYKNRDTNILRNTRIANPQQALSGVFEQMNHHEPHHENVLEIKTTLSKIMRTVSPHLNFHYSSVVEKKRGGERVVRVGFVSAYFNQHSVAKYSCPLMQKLKSHLGGKFNVVGIGVGPYSNPKTRYAKKSHADAFQDCQASCHQYVHFFHGSRTEDFEAIANMKLDVLIYTEVGLSPVLYLMAHARLAPVQLAHLGNAYTHGIDTIDYIVWSPSYMPKGVQSIGIVDNTTGVKVCPSTVPRNVIGFNFTEKVLCLEHLGLYVKKPPTPDDDDLTVAFKLLQNFGIRLRCRQHFAHLDICPEGNDSNYDNAYFFPHSPSKFASASRDHIYRHILEHDPRAKLIFLSGHKDGDYFQNALFNRWNRSIPLDPNHTLRNLKLLRKRMIWLPYTPLSIYLSLGVLSNVVLDVCPNGMGVSALEMLSVNVPVIPSPYCKNVARLSQGFYTYMGFDFLQNDTVANVEDKTHAVDLTRFLPRNDHEFLSQVYKMVNRDKVDGDYEAAMKALVESRTKALFWNEHAFDEWVELLIALAKAARKQFRKE